MKGHTFQLPSYFSSAFVATYLGVRTTARFVDIKDAPTVAGNLKLDTTGAALSVDFGLKFSDVVGIWLTVGVRALVGSNLPAIVYAGATYDHGVDLRVPVRLLRIESSGSQLSLVPYFGYTSGQVATLLPIFLNRPPATLATVLEGNTGELATVPLKTTTFGLNVAFAQAFTPILGLQALAGVGRSVVNIQPFDAAQGERVSTSSGAWAFNLGAAFGIDGAPAGVPIAGLIEYTVARQPSTISLIADPSTQSVHTIAGGLYYSGRRHLQTGIIGSWQVHLNPLHTEIGESARPQSSEVGLMLRYYW